MNISICFILVLCGAFSNAIGEEEKTTQGLKKKLQIGIKRRVDNCKVKSKKGDFLHMHYAVSNLLPRPTSLFTFWLFMATDLLLCIIQ